MLVLYSPAFSAKAIPSMGAFARTGSFPFDFFLLPFLNQAFGQAGIVDAIRSLASLVASSMPPGECVEGGKSQAAVIPTPGPFLGSRSVPAATKPRTATPLVAVVTAGVRGFGMGGYLIGKTSPTRVLMDSPGEAWGVAPRGHTQKSRSQKDDEGISPAWFSQ